MILQVAETEDVSPRDLTSHPAGRDLARRLLSPVLIKIHGRSSMTFRRLLLVVPGCFLVLFLLSEGPAWAQG
jgi:hypothetical protein